jgi:hypothetical protein
VRIQFTIEVCVDYADQASSDVIRSSCQVAARLLRAQALMLALADGPFPFDDSMPKIRMWSDDFLSGHTQIALPDDTDPEISEFEDRLIANMAASG